MTSAYAHLYSSCPKAHDGVCRSEICGERAKVDDQGRWFITMGHVGFNSRANNRNGYDSQEAALAASLRLAYGPAPHVAELAARVAVDAYAPVCHPAGLVWLG